MLAAADSTIIAACLSLAGVLIATGVAVWRELRREVKKMKDENSADHGEVITTLRTVVLGQEQLYHIVDRHIEQHDNLPTSGGTTNIYRKIS